MSFEDANVLVVDRLPLRNDYCAYVHPAKLGELRLKNNAIVELISEENSLICRIAAVENCCQFGFIQISRAMRVNLGVSLGETIEIQPVRKARTAECVVFAPIADTIENITGTYADILFNSGVEFEGLPITQGQIFPVFMLNRVIEFKVVITSPKEQVVIRDRDIIACRNTPVKRKKEPRFNGVCWDDIGGVDTEVMMVRQAVELPLMQPRLIKKMGLTRVRNLLIAAPAGCGKSMIGEAIRNESSARFVLVKCMDLLAVSVEKAIAQILKTTEEAVSNQPAIVFYDDIDAIASSELSEDGDLDSRISNALCSAMKRMKAERGVVVISATRDENRLRRDLKAKIDYKIEMGLPNEVQRMNVLKAASVSYRVKPGALDVLSAMNIGKSCAVLAAECQHMLLNGIAALVKGLDQGEDDVLTINQIRKIAVEVEDRQAGNTENLFENCDFDKPEAYEIKKKADSDLLDMNQEQSMGSSRERTAYDNVAEPSTVEMDEPLIVVDYFKGQTPYSASFQDAEESGNGKKKRKASSEYSDEYSDSDDEPKKKRKGRRSYSYSDSYYYSGSYYSDDDYEYDRPKKRRGSKVKGGKRPRKGDDSYDEEVESGRRGRKGKGKRGRRADSEDRDGKKRRNDTEKQKEVIEEKEQTKVQSESDDELGKYNPFAEKTDAPTEQKKRNPFGNPESGEKGQSGAPAPPVKRRDPFASYEDEEDNAPQGNSASGSIKKRDPFANADDDAPANKKVQAKQAEESKRSSVGQKRTPFGEDAAKKPQAKKRNPFGEDGEQGENKEPAKQAAQKKRDPFADAGNEPNKEKKGTKQQSKASPKRRSPFAEEDSDGDEGQKQASSKKRDPFAANENQESPKKLSGKADVIRKKRSPFADDEEMPKKPSSKGSKNDGKEDAIRKRRDPFAANEEGDEEPQKKPVKKTAGQDVGRNRRNPFGDEDEEDAPKKSSKKASDKQPNPKRRDPFTANDSDEDEAPRKAVKKTKESAPKRRNPFEDAGDDDDVPQKPTKGADAKSSPPKKRDPFAANNESDEEAPKKRAKKPEAKPASQKKRNPFDNDDEDEEPAKAQKAPPAKKRNPFGAKDDSEDEDAPKRGETKPKKWRDPFAAGDDSDEDAGSKGPLKRGDAGKQGPKKRNPFGDDDADEPPKKGRDASKRRDPFAAKEDSDEGDDSKQSSSKGPQKKRNPFGGDDAPNKPAKKTDTKPVAKRRDPFASNDDSDGDEVPRNSARAPPKRRDPFAAQDDSGDDEPRNTAAKKKDPFDGNKQNRAGRKRQDSDSEEERPKKVKRNPFGNAGDSDSDDDGSSRRNQERGKGSKQNPFGRKRDASSDSEDSPARKKGAKRRDPFAAAQDDSDDEAPAPKKKQDPFGSKKRSKPESDDSDDQPAPTKKKQNPFGSKKRSKDDSGDSDDEPSPPKKRRDPFGGNKRSNDDSDSDDVPKKKNDPFARATGKSRNPFD